MTTGRYSRQERFQPLGVHGQAILGQKHVLIIGLGALGSLLAEMLVRAGIGTVTIVDRDYVDLSNLQRQCLYTEEDVHETLPKAIAAKKRLQAINSEVQIQAYVCDVTVSDLSNLVEGVHVILDATDNFETRLMINDVSQKYNIPWIYGACVGSYGVTYTILPKQTPCLRCLLGERKLGRDTCDTVGIIAPAVQMVVSHQVTEVMKILTNHWDSLRRTLFSFDIWRNEMSSVRVDHMRHTDCPSCGSKATYPSLQEKNETKATVLCGRDTVQIRSGFMRQRDLEKLTQSLEKVARNIQKNDYLVTFHIEDYRFVAFRDGRVLVHGTNDNVTAKRLYQQYIDVV